MINFDLMGLGILLIFSGIFTKENLFMDPRVENAFLWRMMDLIILDRSKVGGKVGMVNFFVKNMNIKEAIEMIFLKDLELGMLKT